jgi:hypothetical protein
MFAFNNWPASPTYAEAPADSLLFILYYYQFVKENGMPAGVNRKINEGWCAQ